MTWLLAAVYGSQRRYAGGGGATHAGAAEIADGQNRPNKRGFCKRGCLAEVGTKLPRYPGLHAGGDRRSYETIGTVMV